MLAKNDLLKLFHFVAAAQFFYGLYYEHVHVLPEEIKLRKFSYGGKLIYFTFLDAIVQACFHSIALINDCIGTNELNPSNPPKIRRIRDQIFAVFAFPLAMNVSVLFWSLHSIDRELVFPKVMDPIYPWWLNHILHTNVFIFIVIECFISHHQYPTRDFALKRLSIFVAGYIAWVLIVKVVADAWVYPVLNVLPLIGRIGFFTLAGIFPLLFFFIGEYINIKFWTPRLEAIQKKD